MFLFLFDQINESESESESESTPLYVDFHVLTAAILNFQW